MRILLGVILGMALSAPFVDAFRMSQPPTFSEWTPNTFSQLNTVLADLHNLTNGRYQLDVVLVDPDGSRKGNKGEMVFFDSGTDQLCINSTGATVWKCVNLS